MERFYMSIKSDKLLNKLALSVAKQLLVSGERVAVAESCTGGFVAKVLTDVSGSSAWFDVGFVTYANEAKTTFLGVPARTITRSGAVSKAVVVAMAQGARRRAGADWAVAISGVAGPGGGSARHPVGTVWIAWCQRVGRAARVRAQRFQFKGNRDSVRRQTVAAALTGLLAAANSDS
jgi:nicotinamide-nucleotide amidase